MASILKTGRKNKAEGAAAPPSRTVDETPEPAAADEVTSMEMVTTAARDTPDPGPSSSGVESVYSQPTPALANMPRSYGTMSGYDQGATYAPPDGAEDFQLPQRYLPAEPPPSPEVSPPKPGLLSRVLLFSGEVTPEERDRIAAQEFEQAIAPVLEYMRANQPDATTPEEAARLWAENQGEITPDPMGGSFVAGDAFDRDARVYYRLLRRDYEKTPRPSEKRKESRALSRAGGGDGYRLLPATRGW